MKWIGLLMIALAGVWLGVSASMHLNRRTKTLGQVEKMIVRMDAQIRYTATPVWELVSKAAACDEFSQLSFLKEVGVQQEAQRVDFSTAWGRCIERHGKGADLSREDQELLMEFGKGLGTSDIEGQLNHCRLYQDLFVKQRLLAEQEAAAKGKLYVTLGAAGGMGLALLWI